MKSNKIILMVVAVVLLGLVAYLATRSKAPSGGLYGGENQAPRAPALEGSDNSAAINQELQGVNLGNLESEFQSVDNELKNL